MNSLLKAFYDNLNNTNSVKDKEVVLRRWDDSSKIIKTCLELALNPYKLFYMNKIPKFKANNSGITSFKKFFQLCEKLNKREIVGNEAKDKVKEFLEECHADDAYIFAKIISKSAIGVGAKTVNKVWPDLIPQFGLMLAPNKIADVTKVLYPCAVQPKLDGYRCVFKDGKLWSRAGKPFANKNLTEYFNVLDNVQNYVIDGELYVDGISFNKLQTILNTEQGDLPKGLKYFVYDCVRSDVWEKQKDTPTYETRLSRLRELVNDSIADYSKVIDVATDICETPGEVLKLYKNYIESGFEGVMIKNLNGSYKWKRVSLKTGEMLKLKPYDTLDLEIVEIYDGEGKYVNMAGGVVVDYNSVAVRVGTGFDDATRKAMAESPNDYIGKTVEVRYLEETEDGSLRHPSFVRFREEKD